MNYDWEIQYKNLEAKFNPELTSEPYVLYTLRVYGLNYKIYFIIYIKIPLIFQYDVQYVFQKIKNELIQYNFIDIDLAMKKLHKLYVNQNIEMLGDAFYNVYKESEPFITVFRSKPIRGIVLELVTMNPIYKERM